MAIKSKRSSWRRIINPEIIAAGLEYLPGESVTCMKEAGWDPKDVDVIFPHQPGNDIMQAIMQKAGVLLQLLMPARSKKRSLPENSIINIFSWLKIDLS